MSQVTKVPAHIKPYATASEYVHDQLVLLDLLVDAAMSQLNEQPEQAASLQAFKGMYLSETDAQQLLNVEKTYIMLDAEQDRLITSIEHMIDLRLLQNEQTNQLLPIQKLRQRYELDRLDLIILTTALAPHMNRKYLKLYGYLQDDLTCQYVTPDLLLRLCCRSAEEQAQLYTRLSSSSSRLQTFFTSIEATAVAKKDASLLVEPIALEARLVHFLLDMPWRYDHQKSTITYTDFSLDHLIAPIRVQQYLYTQMINYVQYYAHQSFTLIMVGETGSGKTLLSQHVAIEIGRSVLELDASTLPQERKAFTQQMEWFFNEAKLLHAIPIITHLEHFLPNSVENEIDERFTKLQETILQWQDLLILHSRKTLPFQYKQNQKAVTVTIPLPTLNESTQLWQTLIKPELNITSTQALQLATKFQFTSGQIATTAEQAKLLKQWKEPSTELLQQLHDEHFLSQAAYQLIHHGLQSKASKLQSEWSWNDLILPTETLQLLQQASQRVQNRHIVMNEWGFDALLPYGRGVSMLFTGPPGTGKTMSALVMSKAMHTELYRVDLTRVVSKYIGETEKNLGEIFDRAKLSGAILFFDEADALFGKRSEVKDAHDKYANMETSYLLQKMEEYDGLTILATNFSQNLDDAFMRRIQYVIKFPFPDAVQREQLWQSILPKGYIAEDIDVPFLAKTFELAGGPIKNIVLTAAYLAVEEGCKLGMKQLIEAAIQEYKKTGKLLLKDRLVPYTHYWKG